MDSRDVICPECGSKMVIRTACRGRYASRQFYGCINYPRCKYTIDIEDAGPAGDEDNVTGQSDYRTDHESETTQIEIRTFLRARERFRDPSGQHKQVNLRVTD